METNSINSFLVLITGDIDNFMYTYILVALLVFTGIYFTIRTKGVQFRYIKDMFAQLFEKKVDKNGKAISSFQAMMVSTGSRVGTGNIAGIATALAMGGPGALFWMWVMALIGGASAFIESTLAQIFKIRGKDGQFRGGPAYYIQQGLGKRWMASCSRSRSLPVMWWASTNCKLIMLLLVWNITSLIMRPMVLRWSWGLCSPSLPLLLSLEVRSVFRSSIRGSYPSWRLPISAWAFGSRSRI